MNPDVFFENFELLVDAPDGVQKLRELILQLAVMGKLVPQDPNDESASRLLQKTCQDKKSQLSPKKAKQTNDSQIINGYETEFYLPANWCWAQLSEVVKKERNSIKRGPFGSAIKKAFFVPVGYKVYEQKNAIYNDFSLGDYYIDENKFNELKDFEVKPNDIIVSCSGTIGKLAIAPENIKKGVINQALLKLSLNNNVITNEYFLILFPAFLMNTTMLSELRGTAIKNIVSVGMLKTIPFPFPPLAEQKRIVSKVDELMALCDKLETRRQKKQEIQSKLNSAALDRMFSAENQEEFEQNWQHICENFDLLYDNPENVEKLKQAILQLAVQGKLVPQNPEDELASVLIEKIETDIKKTVDKGNLKKLTSIDSDDVFFKLPNSWKWIQLGKLLTFGPKNGYSPKPVDFVTNTKSLTLSATTSGKFRDDCFKYIDEKIDNDSHLWLEESDILVQRGNSIEYVGIAAVYKGPSHNFIYPDLMMKLRVHQNVNTDFLHIALNNRFSRDYFAEKASGTSGSMPKINQNTVINLPIPLPPLAEQKRIVEKVEQLMGLCDELEAKLRKEQKDSEKLMEAVVKGLLEGAATEKTELEEPIPLQVAAIKLK